MARFRHLSKDRKTKGHARGIVEPQALVKAADSLNILLWNGKVAVVEIAGNTPSVVRLGNNSDSTLRCPAEQDLGLGYNDN